MDRHYLCLSQGTVDLGVLLLESRVEFAAVMRKIAYLPGFDRVNYDSAEDVKKIYLS